jgi:hypothetical protein
MALDAAPGFKGFLGLNVVAVRGRGLAEANLVVGVHSEQVESIVAQLSNESLQYLVPTIRTHIGYLMANPGYHPWFVRPDANEEYISELVQVVLDVGVPFMKQNSDLVEIVKRFREGGYADVGHKMYRLPVCLSLLGDRAAAAALCREYLAEIGDGEGLATTPLRAYLKDLLGSLNAS